MNTDFQYVVASTNKYSKNKVKDDVERMNEVKRVIENNGIKVCICHF